MYVSRLETGFFYSRSYKINFILFESSFFPPGCACSLNAMVIFSSRFCILALILSLFDILICDVGMGFGFFIRAKHKMDEVNSSLSWFDYEIGRNLIDGTCDDL